MFRRCVLSMVVLCLTCAVAFAAPKEKPRKGKPADQAVLNLGASYSNDSEMRVDGNLNDWNGISMLEFSTLIAGEYEYDWTGPKDLSAKVGAQYGADKIYFVVQVEDNAVVDKLRQWKSDRVEIWLAPETADGKPLGSPRGILLDIGPQVSGGKATVKWLSGKQGGLEAVGFVGPEGYDFEVGVSYSALSKESPVMDGVMRYCVLVRDWDQDDANEDEAAFATCPIDPKKSSSIKRDKMGKIPLSLKDAMWSALMADSAIASVSGGWTNQMVNLGGTSMPEIVAAADDTVVVAGFGLENAGLSYYMVQLASAGIGNMSNLAVKDINGDKVPEIILSRQEACVTGNMTATREYVFQFSGQAIDLKTNYITEYHDNSDASIFVKNQYKLNKTGIVQTVDKSSSKSLPACELNGDENMIPVLLPTAGSKSMKHDYL